MYPLAAAVRPVLSFPDGNDFLDAVNEPLGSLEGRLAVGGADGDGHAGLANRHGSQAMHHRAIDQRPAASGFCLQFDQFLLGHLAVTFVVE